MAEMTAAALTMNGRAHHSVGRICFRSDGLIQRRPEARPARAAAVEASAREAAKTVASAALIVRLVEDVVQETLLALHLKRQTWDADQLFTPWVRVWSPATS